MTASPALPANISIAHARLPRSYEAAKSALANCVSLDECMDWANKAEALASYAKQADDDTLEKTARRIRARAIRRVWGTAQTPPSVGGRPSQKGVGGPRRVFQKSGVHLGSTFSFAISIRHRAAERMRKPERLREYRELSAKHGRAPAKSIMMGSIP